MVCSPHFLCCFSMHSLRRYLVRVYIVCLLVCSLPSVADDALAIVTQRSSDLNNFSLETLKLVYLRKLMLDSNGNRWIPLNLPSTHELRQTFSLALYKKLPEEQDDYWNELYFQGVNPPQVLASEEAILRFVAITPGAIGYVHLRNVDDRVKVLKIITISTNNQ